MASSCSKFTQLLLPHDRFAFFFQTPIYPLLAKNKTCVLYLDMSLHTPQVSASNSYSTIRTALSVATRACDFATELLG